MAELKYDKSGRLLFTKEMKQEYQILMPQMLPIHFELIKNVLRLHGYNVKLLTSTDSEAIRLQGLENVHNDTCYPALLVIGQMLDALKSAGRQATFFLPVDTAAWTDDTIRRIVAEGHTPALLLNASGESDADALVASLTAAN